MGRTVYVRLSKIDNSKFTVPELAELLKPANGKGEFFPMYYPDFRFFPNMTSVKVWKELEKKIRNEKKHILQENKNMDKYEATVRAILKIEQNKLLYFNELYTKNNTIFVFNKPYIEDGESDEDIESKIESEINKYCLLAIDVCKRIKNLQCRLHEDHDAVPICPIIIKNKDNNVLTLQLDIEKMFLMIENINYWKEHNYVLYAKKYERLIDLYGNEEYKATPDFLLLFGIKDNEGMYREYKNKIKNNIVDFGDITL